MEVETLLDRLEAEHEYCPANGETALAVIKQFEVRFGYRLPEDMQKFYCRFDSANLFAGQFEIAPIGETVQAGSAICDAPETLPASWFAFCKQGYSGDWIGIDLSLAEPESFPILDLDHNDTRFNVIALSFSEFLADVLTYAAEQPLYWVSDLNQGPPRKPTYGRAECLEAFNREAYEAMFASADQEEIGPEHCQHLNCKRLRISLSVMCARHHFEMVHYGNRPVPTIDRACTAVYYKDRPWISGCS